MRQTLHYPQRPPLVAADAALVPATIRPDTVSRVRLNIGEPFATDGAHKNAASYRGFAIVTPKPHLVASSEEQGWLRDEVAMMNELKDLGFRVAPFDLMDIDGHEALVMPRFAANSKTTAGKLLLNEQSLRDLQEVLDLMQSNRLVLNDLQFLINNFLFDREGRLFLHDPARVGHQRASGDNRQALDIVRDLMMAARWNIALPDHLDVRAHIQRIQGREAVTIELTNDDIVARRRDGSTTSLVGDATRAALTGRGDPNRLPDVEAVVADLNESLPALERDLLANRLGRVMAFVVDSAYRRLPPDVSAADVLRHLVEDLPQAADALDELLRAGADVTLDRATRRIEVRLGERAFAVTDPLAIAGVVPADHEELLTANLAAARDELTTDRPGTGGPRGTTASVPRTFDPYGSDARDDVLGRFFGEDALGVIRNGERRHFVSQDPPGAFDESGRPDPSASAEVGGEFVAPADLPRHPRFASLRLTSQESDTLVEWAESGRDNRDSARRLGISLNTFNRRLERVGDKALVGVAGLRAEVAELTNYHLPLPPDLPPEQEPIFETLAQMARQRKKAITPWAMRVLTASVAHDFIRADVAVALRTSESNVYRSNATTIGELGFDSLRAFQHHARDHIPNAGISSRTSDPLIRSLDDAQRAVLLHRYRGMSDAQTLQSLRWSRTELDDHARSVLRKMGVRSLDEAVQRAYDGGLFDYLRRHEALNVDTSQLDTRERELLALWRQHRDRHPIAEALGVRPETVSAYVSLLARKLNVPFRDLHRVPPAIPDETLLDETARDRAPAEPVARPEATQDEGVPREPSAPRGPRSGGGVVDPARLQDLVTDDLPLRRLLEYLDTRMEGEPPDEELDGLIERALGVPVDDALTLPYVQNFVVDTLMGGSAADVPDLDSLGEPLGPPGGGRHSSEARRTRAEELMRIALQNPTFNLKQVARVAGYAEASQNYVGKILNGVRDELQARADALGVSPRVLTEVRGRASPVLSDQEIGDRAERITSTVLLRPDWPMSRVASELGLSQTYVHRYAHRNKDALHRRAAEQGIELLHVPPPADESVRSFVAAARGHRFLEGFIEFGAQPTALQPESAAYVDGRIEEVERTDFGGDAGDTTLSMSSGWDNPAWYAPDGDSAERRGVRRMLIDRGHDPDVVDVRATAFMADLLQRALRDRDSFAVLGYPEFMRGVTSFAEYIERIAGDEALMEELAARHIAPYPSYRGLVREADNGGVLRPEQLERIAAAPADARAALATRAINDLQSQMTRDWNRFPRGPGGPESRAEYGPSVAYIGSEPARAVFLRPARILREMAYRAGVLDFTRDADLRYRLDVRWTGTPDGPAQRAMRRIDAEIGRLESPEARPDLGSASGLTVRHAVQLLQELKNDIEADLRDATDPT